MGTDLQEAPTRAAVDAEHERLARERQVEEMRENAGDPTGDVQAQMDATRDQPPAPPPIEHLRVDGTTQLGASFGGKAPTSATITLAGGAYELLDGRGYEKGDVIEFRGTAVVFDVGQRDKFDRKTGIVVSCKQRHTALITDVTVTPA